MSYKMDAQFFLCAMLHSLRTFYTSMLVFILQAESSHEDFAVGQLKVARLLHCVVSTNSPQTYLPTWWRRNPL